MKDMPIVIGERDYRGKGSPFWVSEKSLYLLSSSVAERWDTRSCTFSKSMISRSARKSALRAYAFEAMKRPEGLSVRVKAVELF